MNTASRLVYAASALPTTSLLPQPHAMDGLSTPIMRRRLVRPRANALCDECSAPHSARSPIPAFYTKTTDSG